MILTCVIQQHYAKGSQQRADLTAAVEKLQKQSPWTVPVVVGGQEVRSPRNYPSELRDLWQKLTSNPLSDQDIRPVAAVQSS